MRPRTGYSKATLTDAVPRSDQERDVRSVTQAGAVQASLREAAITSCLYPDTG